LPHALEHLFENNRRWSESRRRSDPDFFARLARQQAPEYLWIGCADSRVPANEIIGLDPGQVFVHRNVANVVDHTDLNCLSVIQYAVDVLKVKHIIVCGHYGCGGVIAAMGDRQMGLIDTWLSLLREVAHANRDELRLLEGAARVDRMCELNVAAQVQNLCHSTIVQNAWHRGQPLSLHGLIYHLEDGLLRDLLGASIDGPERVEPAFRFAPPGR
jgi:carbonic anhydrase